MSVLKDIKIEELTEKSIPAIDYINCQFKYTGATYLRECCMKLNAASTTMCTAATYYYKFYENANFEDYDPYLIASTCIYLASKVKNDDVKIRDIINVGYDTIHRKEIPLSLDPYFELRDSLVETELLLMRMLKFELNVELPHRYLLFFLSSLKDWIGEKVFEEFPIIQTSWTILLDIYLVPLHLDYSPSVIAATVIYLTFQIYGIKVQGSNDIGDSPWFTYLHPDCKVAKILSLNSEIISSYSVEKKLKFLP